MCLCCANDETPSDTQRVVLASGTQQTSQAQILENAVGQDFDLAEPFKVQAEVLNLDPCPEPIKEETAPSLERPGDREFIVTLKRDASDRLGMSLVADSKFYCCVERLADQGMICAYNEQAQKGTTIDRGDYIVSVNGVSLDSTEMCRRFKEDTELEIKVMKCVPMTVSIPFVNGLGLDLSYCIDRDYAVIASIAPGDVQKYNDTQSKSNQVKVYSRIVGVDGCSGHVATLLAQLRAPSAKTIELELSGPSK